MIRYFAAAVVLVLTASCNKGGAPEDFKPLRTMAIAKRLLEVRVSRL